MTETGFVPPAQHEDRWSRRPRRSRSDSKIAGVAGGLARHLGVDPILVRVGFVALAVLGGVGVLTYSLLWLLLPAEGDEVSAGEALLGRGRSSVSPVVAAALAVVVVISVFASFNWGGEFWPALLVGVLAVHLARRRRHGPAHQGGAWERRLRATADDIAANRWSDAPAGDVPVTGSGAPGGFPSETAAPAGVSAVPVAGLPRPPTDPTTARSEPRRSGMPPRPRLRPARSRRTTRSARTRSHPGRHRRRSPTASRPGRPRPRGTRSAPHPSPGICRTSIWLPRPTRSRPAAPPRR